MPRDNPLNYCVTCGADFAGLRLFDAHRIGKHDYLYDEGLRMSPPRTNGRRCLTTDEMTEKGWALDVHGRWRDRSRGTKTEALGIPTRNVSDKPLESNASPT